MSRKHLHVETDRVDEAINRVLHSEQAGREAVEACQRQARAIVEDARHKVRRIATRSEQRVAAVHRRCDLGISRALADANVRRAGAGDVAEPDRDHQARVEAAVERLVEEMVGGAP